MLAEPNTLAIFAHPGHELRCLASLQHLKAKIAYLTDASASTGHSRLQQSQKGLAAVGLSVKLVSFTQPDARLYQGLLAQDRHWLYRLFAETCEFLQEQAPELIITDAAEGYNPAHELGHFLTLAAAKKICPHAQVLVTPLTDNPLVLPAGISLANCRVRDLNKTQQETKTRAMKAYAKAAGGMLQQEATEVEERFGPDVHKREILRPTFSARAYLDVYQGQKPFFERHGEKRVAENKYGDVIRLHPHLAFAMQELTELSAC
jgi:LmbE family N-acetylglucosaminyl deacetylase